MQWILYRIIWTLIYLLYSFIQLVLSMIVTLRRKYADYNRILKFEDELKVISKAVKGLDKLPSHIVFVIGNESISMNDLGDVIIWCIAAGISFLSFYDYGGELKKNEAILCKIVSEIHKKYSGNIIWGKKHQINGVCSVNGTKNGLEFLRKVNVNCFSPDDGKNDILLATQQICQKVKEHTMKASDINQEMIDKMIQGYSGVPDPDLAVVCGSLCCTYSLSPWQIRVTEFVRIQSHHNLCVEDFIHVLHKFNKCEQRYGK